jgi:glycosyltransferase involved in cell wall biosynthesis
MATQSVTLLTNFVPPYLVSLFTALRDRVGRLSLVVSTQMEANRPWSFQGESLPVQVQRTLTLPRTWRHPSGFSETTYLHLPVDTLPILWRERPDVIVSTELGLRTLQALVYRMLRPRTRIVLWVSISEDSERGRGRVREVLRRWILDRIDAVVVSGESGARYIAALGFPDEAIFRMPLYAARTDAPRPPPRNRTQREQRRLLYVGQLVSRKGIDGFLDVLARWAGERPQQEVEFWIVGDGPARTALEARRLPSNVRLRFCGNVAYDDLNDYYARTGLLVFPTLADDWGVVVNEALAMGMPVLGSVRSQAVADVVREGHTGWRFRPESPEEMLAALDRAFSTPTVALERMRGECLEQARRFAPEIVVEQMLAAIAFATRATSDAPAREVA